MPGQFRLCPSESAVYTGRVSFDPANPLIVQADRSVFLEAFNPRAEDARRALAPFAELISSPEHLHTYRVTPLSLWNAASAGMSAAEMVGALEQYAKFPVPQNVVTDIRELAGRWGRLRLIAHDGGLLLVADTQDAPLLTELSRQKAVSPLLGDRMGDGIYAVPLLNRGLIKTALLESGWPLDDQAGTATGWNTPFRCCRVWRCATTSRRPPTPSTGAAAPRAAAAWWCWPLAAARRWWAWSP